MKHETTNAKGKTMATATTYQPLTGPTDTRIIAFLTAWHENGRDHFEQHYPNLDYDRDYAKHASGRRKYICLDCGSSGHMMAEKATGKVYGIKAYGSIHRGHPCGDIEDATREYREATANNRIVRPRG